MAAPASYDNIQQVSCVVDFDSRDALINSDAYMKNCSVEATPEARYAVKRPGLAAVKQLISTTGPLFTSYVGQGIFGSDQSGYTTFVMDDIVGFLSSTNVLNTYALPPGVPPTPQAPFRMVGIRGVTGGECLLQAENLYSSTPTFTGFVTALNLSTITPGGGALVPSLCELNSTYYLMFNQNRIYASTPGDPTSWPALNYVVIDSVFGIPVCMVRHLNYLIAFCAKGSIAYYDAGISPGASIAPVPNAVFLEGMAIDGHQTAASTDDDELFWIGSGATSGFTVQMMIGLSITTVSTESVERVLEAYLKPIGVANNSRWYYGYARTIFPRGLCMQVAGHSYYILTFPTFTYNSVTYPGITLAYDIRKKHWSIWTQIVAGVEKEFQPFAVSLLPSFNKMVIIDRFSGYLTELSATTYQDLGQPINMEIQTDLFNWGNQRTKMIPATYLQADTMASSVNVQWTDDDYNTFNTAQSVSTNSVKKQLIRCGSTTQRGWKLTHTDNTPMRLYGLEVEVIPGAL